MPRNFYRRIETVFPIESQEIKERIIGEILPIAMADNVKARVLGQDGTYERIFPADGEPPVRSQLVFQALASLRSRQERMELVQRFRPISSAPAGETLRSNRRLDAGPRAAGFFAPGHDLLLRS
jgi:polyphosphate kinase